MTGDVLVEEVDARSEPEVLPDDPVQDSVGPAAVPAVGLPPHALADEARSLGVPNGALVEAVDLELQSMEAELEEQVALEEPRRLVREPLPPELRVDREPAELSDATAAVRGLELHRPRGLAVRLDHEQPVVGRLSLRALDLREDGVVIHRPQGGEVRLHLLVGQELDEEIGVRGLGAAQPHGAGSTAGRRSGRQAPEPSATPARISTRPASAGARNGSSRISAP